MGRDRRAIHPAIGVRNEWDPRECDDHQPHQHETRPQDECDDGRSPPPSDDRMASHPLGWRERPSPEGPCGHCANSLQHPTETLRHIYEENQDEVRPQKCDSGGGPDGRSEPECQLGQLMRLAVPRGREASSSWSWRAKT